MLGHIRILSHLVSQYDRVLGTESFYNLPFSNNMKTPQNYTFSIKYYSTYIVHNNEWNIKIKLLY
jgi:hypothetical protein